MSDMFYIYAGWGVALGVLGLYTFTLMLRGRSLSRRVPVEKRRWTS